MRYRLITLSVASTATIVGMALATALISAPAQASRSGANSGHPASSRPGPAGAAQAAAHSGAAGLITGVVEGPGAVRLIGACVVATGRGGVAFALTRSDGRYVLGGLRQGGYTLHYSACAAGGHYLDQWSGGASWPDGATTVAVAPGQARELAPVTLRTTLPAAQTATQLAAARFIASHTRPTGLARLRPAGAIATRPGSASVTGTGAIAGKVTGGGKPLKGICVTAVGRGYRQALTSKAGQYRIADLRPGRYDVYFFPNSGCGKNPGNWLPQLYKGINGPFFRHRATRVPVAAGKTTGSIDAALRLGGEITGTVRSQGGKVVPRVCVEAQQISTRFPSGGFTISAKNGSYALHSLVPGKYQVEFLPRFCGSTGNYIPQWWRDSPTLKHATTIVITSGRIVRKVDAALRPGAILRGVVRGGGAHGPLLKGICVLAVPQSRVPFAFFARGVTGRNGSYRLVGLTTGKYAVTFNRGCGNNGNYLPANRSVSVVAGHTTSGFDAFLPAGAIITGTVTGTHGAPVRGICVSASNSRNYSAATSKADGTYSIIALGTGHYTVRFSGGCGNSGSYAPQWYHGQSNVASADPVVATAGHTTAHIDAAMQPGGTITGVVTDTSGNRLNDICVVVANRSEAQLGFAFNFEFTKNGTYMAANLVPGAYAVSFGCFGREKLARQWFMGQPSQATASYVSAPAGVVTSGVSAVMRPGGLITGVVTNSAGKPLSGICVQAVPHGSQVPAFSKFFFGNLAFTNSKGVYRIGPLAAASYDVQFNSCFGSGRRYSSQWYRGTASRASARPVAVAVASTATGISAVLTGGGSISGEATNDANTPQADICVAASDAADHTSGFAFTNSSGQYTIADLSSGAYQITFSDCGYGRHHVTLGTAIRPGLVAVAAPNAVTGVNEQLFPAGSISGTVLGGPGATPQEGACVVAVPAGPNTGFQQTQTGSHGGYRLPGLAPGTYHVYFGDPFCFFAEPGYAPQWYNDQASEATATTVTVSSGADTTGIGATLGADGAISGTVTDQSHAAVAGECVTAAPVSPAPDPLFGEALHPVIGVTAPDGTYALVGLLPGQYTVEFSVGCGDTRFRAQWWNDARSAAKATVITVSAGTTVAGIDAALRH